LRTVAITDDSKDSSLVEIWSRLVAASEPTFIDCCEEVWQVSPESVRGSFEDFLNVATAKKKIEFRILKSKLDVEQLIGFACDQYPALDGEERFEHVFGLLVRSVKPVGLLAETTHEIVNRKLFYSPLTVSFFAFLSIAFAFAGPLVACYAFDNPFAILYSVLSVFIGAAIPLTLIFTSPQDQILDLRSNGPGRTILVEAVSASCHVN